MKRFAFSWEEIWWLPFAVGLGIGVVTLGLTAQLQKQNQEHIKQIVNTQAEAMVAAVDRDLHIRVADLSRMADEWELRNGIPKPEWEAMTAQYVIDRPGYHGIEWVDEDSIVRWIVPFEGNESAVNLDLKFEGRRTETLQAALESGKFTMTRPIDLVQGGQGLIGFIPLFSQGRFDGFISAVFRIEPWLHDVLTQSLLSDFVVAGTVNGEAIFSSGDIGNNVSPKWAREIEIPIANLIWRFKVCPSLAFIAENHSSLPSVILGAGLLTMILASTGLRLAQLTVRRAAELKEQTDGLTQEAIRRESAEQETQESEERYRSLVEHAPFSIQEIDRSGACVSMNPVGLELIGVEKEQDVIGLQYFESLQPEVQKRIAPVWQRALEGQSSEIEYVLGTNGNTKHVVSSFIPMTGLNGMVQQVMSLTHDITDRKISEQTRNLPKVVLAQLVEGAPLEEIFKTLCQEVEHLFDQSVCSIMMLDPSKGFLQMVSAPNAPTGICEALNGLIPGEQAGSCGTAIYTGEIVIVTDTTTDPRWAGFQDFVNRFGVKACWSIPIFSESNEALGTFAISHLQHRSPTSQEITILKTASYLAGVSIDRRKSEEQLHDSEKRFRDLYDSAPLAYVSADKEGVIQMVNSGLEALTGYSKEELIGRSVLNLYAPTPNGKEKAIALDKQICEGQEIYGEELEIERADGTRLWANLTVGLLKDDQGNLIERRGVLEDVTLRYQSKFLLTEQNTLFEMMAVGEPLSAIMERLCRMIEAASPDMCCSVYFLNGDTLEFVAAPNLPGTFQEKVKKIQIGPCAGSCGTAAYRKEPVIVSEIATDPLWARGHRLALSHGLQACWSTPITASSGAVLGTIAVYYNVARAPYTDERAFVETATYLARIAIQKGKSEDLLLESEARYRDLFDDAPLAYISASPDGQIQMVNAKTLELFGLSKEDILGLYIVDLFAATPHGKEKVFHLNQQAQEGKEFFGEELELQRPDQTRRWVSATVQLIYDHEGQVIARRGILEDITARKHAEQALHNRSQLAVFDAAVSHHVAQGEDIPEMLCACTETMIEHLGAAFARIWTLNEQDQILELQASSGLYTHTDGPHSRIPMGQLKIGMIASERKPHLTNSVIGDPRVPEQDWAKQEGLVAFAGYPLLINGRVIGVMSLFARHHLSGVTLRMLETVADRIALGVERKRAENALSAQRIFLRQVIDSIPNLIFAKDPEGRFTLANQAVAEVYGMTVDSLLGKPDTLFNPDKNEEALFRPPDRGQSHSLNELVQFEQAVIDVRQNIRWFQTVKRPLVSQDGREYHLLGVSTDLSERRRAEKNLRAMVEGTATATSTDFFRSLVSCLASALHVSCTFVAECTDETKSRVRTLAFMKDRNFIPTMEYDLEGTPCRQVIDDHVVYHPQEVQAIYPQDEALTKLGVQCYLGMPLHSTSGEVIGHLAILNTKPIVFDAQTESMVKVFAARAGAELERHRAEKALQKSEQDLRYTLAVQTRISQDLHDHILQSLYAVGLIISTAKKPSNQGNPNKVSELIDQGVAQLNYSIAEIRAFIQSLHQSDHSDVDLAFELKQLVESLTVSVAPHISLSISFVAVDLLTRLEKAQLLNIAREGLRNACQHSQSTQVHIQISRTKQGVRLCIKDNGVGFDEDQTILGYGLKNMKDRVRQIGGLFRVVTLPQQGTQIIVELIVEKPTDEK